MTSFSTMKTRRVDKMYHVYAASSSLKIFLQILSVLVWICHHRWNEWRKLGFHKVVTWIWQNCSIYFFISLDMPSRSRYVWRKLRPEFGEKSLYKLLPPLWVKSCGFKRGGITRTKDMDFSRIFPSFYMDLSKLVNCWMFTIRFLGIPKGGRGVRRFRNYS